MNKKKVYIFGHKNPDTDSICSAIACAYLKNQMVTKCKENEMLYLGKVEENTLYIPKRAGAVNSETEYVLKRFGFDAPECMLDVRKQVSDLSIRKISGIDKMLSLKRAWMCMRSVNVATLPIIDENEQVEGLITMSDIARAYMAVFDNAILSAAKTPYNNLLDALDGTMLVGNTDEIIDKGRIFIAAANIEMMRDRIAPGDLVILGNRYETQLFAIENKVNCIIVCEGAPVSRTIRKLAEESNVKIISTPHDTYSVARLITQSVPVNYFMTSEKLVTFSENDFIDDIVGMMTKLRHRDFPVLSMENKLVGLISRRSLLNMSQKQVILVDHNEIDQAVDGIEDTEVVEIVDHHKLGTVETIKPVTVRNQPVGCTATIIYQMYMENGIDMPKNIAGILCSAILSDTLLFRSPTCTQMDKDAVAALSLIGDLNPEELAENMFRAGSNIDAKTDQDLFYQDYKKFASNGYKYGVGQVLLMTDEDIDKAKEKVMDYLEIARKEQGMDMVFLMMTNIIKETTEVICAGQKATEILAEGFENCMKDGKCILEKVVSRKKQFIPQVMAAMQQ